MRWHAWLMGAGLLGSLTFLGNATPTRSLGLIQDEQADVSQERISRLIGRLGNQEFRERERAMKELEAIGEPAKQDLERAAQSKDPEVRWRARQLLSKIEGPRGTAPEGRSSRDRLRPVDPDEDARGRGLQPKRRDLDGFDQQIEQLMRELEDDMRRFGSSRDLSHWLDRERETRSGLDELEQLFGRGASGQRRMTIHNNGTRLSVSVGEDGKVEAELEENGETSTLEADSLEQFQEEHGALLERLGVRSLDFGSGGFGLRSFSRGPGFDFGLPFEPFERFGPRLGVRVGPVDEALRSHLGLTSGMLVDSVDRGSVADRLGLERLDIILRFNGAEIEDVTDLRAAFVAVESGGSIEVEIIRRGQAQELQGNR
ncbi:MAG: PDZ domain-containing protein [Planctomycetota bacterium]